MADAATTIYAMVLPEVGASADTWGSKLNNDFSDLDALSGALTTTGSANAYVLTTGLSLAAYVTGQRFLIKTNFANTGAATINVDGLGAKNLTKNGTTALASGDLSSGVYYFIVYDGTQFQIVGALNNTVQPLDATLTALAALSWSSGNALIQMTAADTVSLTLTPQVTSLDLGGVTDTTLTRSSAGVIAVEGVDVVLCSGSQTVAGAKTFTSPVIVSAANASLDVFTGATTNAAWVQLRDNSRYDQIQKIAGGLNVSLNVTGTPVNFLFGTNGTFCARTDTSSEASGTLTSASANKVVKATAGVTINDGVFTAGDHVEIYNDSDSSITLTQDTGMTLRLSGTTTTGNRTLAARTIALVYFDTNSDATVGGSGVS